MKNATLVLGASLKSERYSNKAIKLLLDYKHQVVALGLRKGQVNTITIETEKLPFKTIDTVTLYLNPARQEEYYTYIISLKPRRVIFNPGTENNNFIKILKENGIYSLKACTLVLLRIHQY